MKTKILILLGVFATFVVNAQTPTNILVNGNNVGEQYSLCRGSVVLSTPISSGVFYWQKTTPDGNTTEVDNSETINLDANDLDPFAKYEVYVNIDGTIYYGWLELTINEYPEVNTLVNTSVCEGSEVIFSATNTPLANHTYQWYENGVEIPGEETYQLSFQGNLSLNGRRYECRVTPAYGCSTLATNSGGGALLTVNPLPTATFSPSDKEICAGEEIDLVVTPTAGIAPFTVTMQNGTDDLIAPYISPTTVNTLGATATFRVYPTSTTTYHFTILDDNGCQREY